MTDFEKIKATTAQILKAYSSKTNQVKDWKKEIRACLMEVKSNFTEWLDDITNKFLVSLKDIENQGDLKHMAGTDLRVT